MHVCMYVCQSPACLHSEREAHRICAYLLYAINSTGYQKEGVYTVVIHDFVPKSAVGGSKAGKQVVDRYAGRP
jgi:hypothetical protein